MLIVLLFALCLYIQVSSSEPKSTSATVTSRQSMLTLSQRNLPLPLLDPGQTPVTPSTITARPAAEFNLSSFLFSPEAIGQRAVKEKKKKRNERAQTEVELTKPQKLLKFFTNPLSKVYALFLRAHPFSMSATRFSKERSHASTSSFQLWSSNCKRF